MARYQRLALCLAASLLADVSIGDETTLEPLLEVLPTSTNGYPFVRCAALYSTAAILSVGRDNTFPSDYIDQASRLIGMHLLFAHLARGFAPPTDAHVDESVVSDTDMISDLYRRHMEAEYSARGTFQSPMVAEDLKVCKALERKLMP